MTKRIFSNGAIKASSLKLAEIAARIELAPVEAFFRKLGWCNAIGASGTIRAIRSVVRENGWSDEVITPDSLKQCWSGLYNYTKLAWIFPSANTINMVLTLQNLPR